VKANRGQIERALRAPADIRLFLLHGPDDSGSRALVRLLADGLGGEAERVELSGSEIRSHPARLADEAASISLFGGARYVLIDPAGEESVPAVEGLLGAPAAGNPVLLLAGDLRATSRLLKLALGDDRAMAFASYLPEGRDANRLVLEMARERGLILNPEIASRIVEEMGVNRAILALELDKFALYLDAAPERPQCLEHDSLDALGAAREGGDLSRLVESVGGGDLGQLQAELLRLAGEGVNGILLIRAVLRRMTLLARLRGEVERGNSVDAVMASQGKSVFWKEKASLGQQLARWRSDLLAKSVSRLLDAERQVKAPGGLGPIAVDEELFAICRQAARLR
jgi:DNA polymerase-3 subunit delta